VKDRGDAGRVVGRLKLGRLRALEIIASRVRYARYLARVGKSIADRAFGLYYESILFIGVGTYRPEDLATLIPRDTEHHVGAAVPPRLVPDIIVVGRDAIEREFGTWMDLIRRRSRHAPKILPQEGFLDELLFGGKWWEKSETERSRLSHPGLELLDDASLLLSPGSVFPPLKRPNPSRPLTSDKLKNWNSPASAVLPKIW
jgi:hypothetical protein